MVATDFRRSDGTSAVDSADAVTASASGLDPHISPANAVLQAARVAAARKVDVAKVMSLIEQYTDGRDLGLLGDPGVNVLRLNLAMDSQFSPSRASRCRTGGGGTGVGNGIIAGKNGGAGGGGSSNDDGHHFTLRRGCGRRNLPTGSARFTAVR